MAVLSRPDWRDATSLPPQDIAWHASMASPRRPCAACASACCMDAGWGLPWTPRPPPRCRPRRAPSRRAGAVVEPLRAVHDARDGRRHRPLLAHALVARHLGAAARAPATWCCPTSATGSAAAGGCSAAAAVPRLQPDGRAARRGGGRLPALRLRALAGERRCRPSRPSGRARPTTRSSAIEHIAFTLPYNMSEQPAISDRLRLHGGRPADRPADRRPPPRRPRRAAAGPRLGVAAPAAAALAGAALTAPPAGTRRERATFRAMSHADPRGNPTGSASAAARDAAEQALWRMMSFYDTPLADLDAAIAADPGWALPHVMKAGFLLSLTEPGLLRRGRRPPVARACPVQGGAGARARPPRSRAAGAGRPLARGLPRLGRAAARAPARRAGAAVGAAVGLLPRRCQRPAAAPGARAARVGRRPIRCTRYVLGAVRLRPRGEQPLPAGRGRRPPCAAGQPARALGRARGGARDGDAGPLRGRLGLAAPAPAGAGPRATASPATCGGTRRCSAWRRWTPPACCAWSTRTSAATRCRSRCSAWTPRRCCGGCTCWARTCPRAAPRRWSRLARPTSTPATTPSTTCTPCIALLGAGEVRARRGVAGALRRARAAARRGAAAATTQMAREVGLPLMRGLLALARGDADGAADMIYPVRAAGGAAAAAAMRSAT